LRDHDAMARRMKSSSWARIVSTPTASLSWNTRPARIDSMIAGVPPSSRCSGSVEVAVLSGLTYATVPPPTGSGTRFASSGAWRRARPACPGPPMNLWGDRNTASL
jgi:hypothetical protein